MADPGEKRQSTGTSLDDVIPAPAAKEGVHLDMAAATTADLPPWEDVRCASYSQHETLVAAVAAAVVKPIANTIQESLNVRFAELAANLIQALHDTGKRDAAALATELSPLLVAKLAPELATEVGHRMTEAHAAAEEQPDHSDLRRQNHCFTYASSHSAESAIKKATSNATSQGGSDSSKRDVRALENTLADQLLEESGLGPTPLQVRGKRKPGAMADCHRGKPVASVLLPEPEPRPNTGTAGAEEAPTALARATAALAAASSDVSAAEDDSSSGRDEELRRDDIAPALPHSVSPQPTSGSMSTVKWKGKPSTAREVLKVRIQELTEEIPISCDADYSDSDEECAAPRPRPLPVLLAVSGIVPCDRCGSPKVWRWYQCLVGLLAVLTSAFVCFELAGTLRGFWSTSGGCTSPGAVCWRRSGLLSSIPVAAGSALGFLLLQPWKGSKGIFETLKMFQSYAHQMELTELWRSQANLEMAWALVVWLCATAAAGIGLWLDSGGGLPSPPAALSLLLFSFMAGVFMCLCFSQLYVCRALVLFVDTFCCNVVDSPVLSDATHKWNVLQAVLRKGSGSIEWSFLAIQGASAFTVPLLMADFFMLGMQLGAIPALLPVAVLTLGVLRMFLLAAAVTDKCTRVPALLNSLSFGPGTELKRQRIVEYVANSAAGFYVIDVRLTTSMALKFLYMWVVVAFGVCSQFLAT